MASAASTLGTSDSEYLPSFETEIDDEPIEQPPDIDLQFENIAHETLQCNPELQISDLYAVLFRSYCPNGRATAVVQQTKSSNSLPHFLLSNHPNIVNAILILVVSLIAAIFIVQPSIGYLLGIRCFVPNNYLVWEATRPIADCSYCRNVQRPLILPNMTREEFLPFAYSVQPIIIKRGVAHWTTTSTLNFTYLRKLYWQNRADLRNFHDECQFLNFKSNFLTLENFFEMSDERALTGNPPWYVGFSNCQTSVLRKLRRLYPIPHFLPADAEVPNTDYIFMGFDQGATMHLDYIPRLMWQAQLLGNKSWDVAPAPECADVCSRFSFYVEPGDAVLMDTRIWYHGTTVLNGEFSLTVQSEYG